MKTYLKIFLVSLVIFIVDSGNCFSQTTSYKGRIIYQVYNNGVLDTIFTKTNAYICNHYVLEKIANLTLTDYGDEERKPSQLTRILQYYILTDLRLRQCVEISLSDTPFIMKKYPLEEKQRGIKLVGDVPVLKNEIQHFKKDKDTLIEGEKYLVLKDVSRFKMSDNFTVQTVKVLLSYKLHNCPIHLISESLDKKYGGGITMLIYNFENNYKSVMITGIDPMLSKRENEDISRYIQFYRGSVK